MLRLGLIRDGNLAPAEYAKVRLVSVSGTDGKLNPLVTTIEAGRKKQRFELCLHVDAAREPKDWAVEMAGGLSDIGWSHWWLDTDSVSLALNRHVTEALSSFGLAFFPEYARERRSGGVVLLEVGVKREAVLAAAELWRKATPGLTLSAEHDFEAAERLAAEESSARPKGLKRFFPFSALFTSTGKGG